MIKGQDMIKNYSIKFRTIVLFTLLAAVSTATAASDDAARPSLSAKEHFAVAKAIDDENENTEQEVSTIVDPNFQTVN